MDIIKPVIRNFEKKCLNIPLLFKLYSIQYNHILNREIELGKLRKEDVILNIGCGAMPFTAIYLAKKTKAQIIAIDIDEEAIANAKKCIKKLGLENQIKICKGDGSEAKFDHFTAVVVALQAEPKERVLDNLLNQAKNGTRFIFRGAREIFAHQYDELPKKYTPAKIAKQYMITFDKSVLYVK